MRFEAGSFTRGAATTDSTPSTSASGTAMMRVEAVESRCDAADVCELARLSQKKESEYLTCWLRTDKVFVYFTRNEIACM